MATDEQRTWLELRTRERAEHPDIFAAYDAFKRAVKTGEPIDPARPFILVERPEDLPLFASEDEGHEYWGVHGMGDAFFDGATLDDDEYALIERARRRRGRPER